MRLVLSIAWAVAVAVAVSLLDTVFCGRAPAARNVERHTMDIEYIRPPASGAATRVPTFRDPALAIEGAESARERSGRRAYDGRSEYAANRRGIAAGAAERGVFSKVRMVDLHSVARLSVSNSETRHGRASLET
jgi:hypothetical protein